MEVAEAEHVDRYDHRRLHGEPGMLPPVECEARFATEPVVVAG